MSKQLLTISYLIEILYTRNSLILPFTVATPRSLAFLHEIFPEKLLNHTIISKDGTKIDFDARKTWNSPSRLSKLINGESGPRFSENITTLLNRDNEIIKDIYRNWNSFWEKNGGNFSLFRKQLLKEGCKNETLIDSGIGDKLSKIILNSDDPALVLTIVSLYALLGTNANKLSFECYSLSPRDTQTPPIHNNASMIGRIITPPYSEIFLLQEIISDSTKKQYQILEFLGQGSHSTVYKALELTENKSYTISFYSPFALSDCAIFTNINLQIMLKYEISHPSLSRIYGIYSEPSQNLYYIIQEYIPGYTLTLESKCGSARKMIIYLYQILGALSYLHSQGIIHGDITANNIIIDSTDNCAKIIDYSDMNISGNPCTSTTELLNDDVFYSPEKLANEIADFRTDIFSLGALIKYLLANIHDREGISTETVLNLYFIIETATQRVPAKRYQSISELIQALNVAFGFSPLKSTDEILVYMDEHPSAFDAPQKIAYTLTRLCTKETILLPSTSGLYFIGTNSKKCNYSIDNPNISLIHCCLTINEAAGIMITDMHSANGTWINDRKLLSGHLYPIANNNILRLADETFLFQQKII